MVLAFVSVGVGEAQGVSQASLTLGGTRLLYSCSVAAKQNTTNFVTSNNIHLYLTVSVGQMSRRALAGFCSGSHKAEVKVLSTAETSSKTRSSSTKLLVESNPGRRRPEVLVCPIQAGGLSQLLEPALRPWSSGPPTVGQLTSAKLAGVSPLHCRASYVM